MISAIVLAAGLSSRMKDGNKLLLPFKNNTVIETVVENIIASGAEEVIVVTGHHAEQVQKQLAYLPVNIIYNADFERGMTTSIQKGVSIAKGNGYMICLSDMPHITANEYNQLKTFFEKRLQLNEACICIAAHKNKNGNPVIFSAYYKNLILQHTGMQGCKEIIRANDRNIYSVETGSDNIFRDIDTKEDYLSSIYK